MKILNIKKFVKNSTILIISIVGILLIICSSSYSNAKITYKEIYVISGDTLWSIATEQYNKNSYYKNYDVRDIIQDIRKINNISNSTLSVGDKILIPNI